MDYTDFLVRNCPMSALYIPNFITSEEEQHILAQVEKTPKPKWTQLSHRRLINYGGVPHVNGMIAEEIPPWLQAFMDKINNLGIFESKKANHVLVNEYLPGQGIMPHTDGPLFFPIISTISCGSHTILEFYKKLSEEEVSPSYTATSPSTPNDGSPKFESSEKRLPFCKLLIEPRSLLILKDSLYIDYLHSIAERTEDVLCDSVCNLENCETAYKFGDKITRKKRISLTIRFKVLETEMGENPRARSFWSKNSAFVPNENIDRLCDFI